MERPWQIFFREKITKIFTEKDYIIDIGGGLRINPSKNNRRRENEWIEPYLGRVNYVILDKVADYRPDLVGDIHDLPLPDNSVDAIICMSVLEHVEEPHRAVAEMHRVLKPGGFCYIDVPFLFFYHPLEGYYKDYYRFTPDGLAYLTRSFSSVEIQNVRGSLATVMNLIPIFTKRTGFFEAIDAFMGKESSRQSAALRAFCVK